GCTATAEQATALSEGLSCGSFSLRFFSLFPGLLARIADASFRPLQVKVCVDRLVPWFHISPILDVMVRVHPGGHRMMPVPVLRATGDVKKLEFHALAVR